MYISKLAYFRSSRRYELIFDGTRSKSILV